MAAQLQIYMYAARDLQPWFIMYLFDIAQPCDDKLTPSFSYYENKDWVLGLRFRNTPTIEDFGLTFQDA